MAKPQLDRGLERGDDLFEQQLGGRVVARLRLEQGEYVGEGKRAELVDAQSRIRDLEGLGVEAAAAAGGAGVGLHEAQGAVA